MVFCLRLFFVISLGWTVLSAQNDLKWKDLGGGMLKPGLWVQEWLDDAQYVYRLDNKLMVRNVRNGRVRTLLDPARMAAVTAIGIQPMGYESVGSDYIELLYLHEGDIYHYNYKSSQLTRLTDTKGEEQNPTLSPDGTLVAYTRDGNLFLQHLADPGVEIHLSDDGSEEILNGYASWVYYEEILGRRTNYRAFWFSPDSRKLVFMRFDQSQVPLYPVLWFNELYGKLEMQRYPKPGMANPEVSIWLVDLASRKKEELSIPDTAGNYLAFPRFSPYNNDLLYIQWLNRDQNHLKLFVRRMAAGETRIAYEETQTTWIDFLEEPDLLFLPQEQILFRSSQDGWFHLYLAGRNGEVRQLTRGPWSVNGVEAIETDAKSVLMTAYKEDSTRRDLYRLELRTGALKRLTDDSGSHICRVSPRGSYFIDTVSTLTKPASIHLVDSKARKKTLIADTSTERFKSMLFSQPQLIRVTTADGFSLPVIYTLPRDYKPGQRYPVILSVYGGPGARGVSDSFSRGFFNNQYLAQQGIVTISADHRGAGHHGKAGMNAMHRRLGDVEMADYSAVIDHFIANGIADPKRIGISGGSYGGYVSALALTRESARFKYGIAHFSVTDWSLYDSVYTERYMDTPEQNPDGYRAASVLSYVDLYKSGLLLTHGTVDDNVHMQNTMQLADKLQDAGKPFQMMLYPRSRHGFRASKREFSRREEMDFWMRSFFNKPFLMEEEK